MAVGANVGTPINIWVLCAAATPPAQDMQLCRDVLRAHRTRSEDALVAAVEAISGSGRGIAIEFDAPTSTRRFKLPGDDVSLSLQELTFGEGGYGHRVWEAGIALAIACSLQEKRAPSGDMTGAPLRMLELGSGVGVAGIAAARAAGDSALLTLTDGGHETRGPVERSLLGNLRRNAALNGVPATVAALDWHACLESGFAPVGKYDRVLASDCIYHKHDGAHISHLGALYECLAHATPHAMRAPARPLATRLFERVESCMDS